MCDVDANVAVFHCSMTNEMHIRVQVAYDVNTNTFAVLNIIDCNDVPQMMDNQALEATILRCVEHNFNIERVKAQAFALA
jgi:CTP synthase (UTP-ammonia lyase)